MFYNNMEVNCKVFSSKQDWRIRVVFGEDGAPVFCALDVAASMGFMAPQKAVARFKGELVVAPIPWNNTARKGCSAMRCLTERSLMVRHRIAEPPRHPSPRPLRPRRSP